MTDKQIKDIEEALERNIGNRYKNLDELINEIEDLMKNLLMAVGGGYYGVKFYELLPYLKEKQRKQMMKQRTNK